MALETVQAVLELYGAGLERIISQLGEARTTSLAADELVEHLLLLHGLHPVSVEERVRAALDGVRPYLGSHGGDVELLGVSDGVASVRMRGSCEGCPASAMTLKLAIEDAVLKAAPDIERVEAQDDGAAQATPSAAPLLQIEVVGPPAPEAAWATAGALPQLSGGGLLLKEVAGERSSSCVSRTGRRTPTCPSARAAGARSKAAHCRAADWWGPSSPVRIADTATTWSGPAAVWTRPNCISSPCPCSSTSPGWSGSPSRPRRSRTDGLPAGQARPGHARPSAGGRGAPKRGRSNATCAPPRWAPAIATSSTSTTGGCCARAGPARCCSIPRPRAVVTSAWCRRAGGGSTTSSSTTRAGSACGSPSTWRSSSATREAERVSAFYPSPAGPTESLLELEAWTELEADNPVLAELEPDVEALLVSRARDMREHWLVPIDDCYELVGLIRSRWRGFGGGEEVWAEIDRFFDDLPTREQTRW